MRPPRQAIHDNVSLGNDSLNPGSVNAASLQHVPLCISDPSILSLSITHIYSVFQNMRKVTVLSWLIERIEMQSDDSREETITLTVQNSHRH